MAPGRDRSPKGPRAAGGRRTQSPGSRAVLRGTQVSGDGSWHPYVGCARRKSLISWVRKDRWLLCSHVEMNHCCSLQVKVLWSNPYSITRSILSEICTWSIKNKLYVGKWPLSLWRVKPRWHCSQNELWAPKDTSNTTCKGALLCSTTQTDKYRRMHHVSTWTSLNMNQVLTLMFDTGSFFQMGPNDLWMHSHTKNAHNQISTIFHFSWFEKQLLLLSMLYF